MAAGPSNQNLAPGVHDMSAMTSHTTRAPIPGQSHYSGVPTATQRRYVNPSEVSFGQQEEGRWPDYRAVEQQYRPPGLLDLNMSERDIVFLNQTLTSAQQNAELVRRMQAYPPHDSNRRDFL